MILIGCEEALRGADWENYKISSKSSDTAHKGARYKYEEYKTKSISQSNKIGKREILKKRLRPETAG